MTEPTKTEELKVQLEKELAKWQTRIDEARVQANLGSKEAEDKLRPHLEKLENELADAKIKWAKLDEASENSWSDIKQGLDVSVDAMKEVFSKARKHFEDKAS